MRLAVNVLEQRAAAEAPEDYVRRLARDKACAGVQALSERDLAYGPVLGADTIGICDGLLLEKPENLDDAMDMLLAMSGREHRVLTAICLADGNQQRAALSETRVFFRPLSRAQIEDYWATGEPRDKAGAYAIQGLGAVFVERIEGSYSGVVGLPIEQVVPLLKAFAVDCWRPCSSLEK